MEQFQIKSLGKLGSVALSSLALLLTTSQAHSLTGHWICGSGAWEDASCWDYTDTRGDPGPFTPSMIDDEAQFISSDDTNRTVTRSTQHDPAFYRLDYEGNMTIDARGKGSMTVVHKAGIAGFPDGYASYQVGKSGTGTLVQEGGDIYSTITLGVDAGSSGTYNLNNGVVSTEYALIVGLNGNGQVTQAGGNASFGLMEVGDREGSTGTYNLEDGRLRMGYNAVADISTIGNAGTGVFNQSGGYHGAASGIVVGGNATGHGTYNMSGGEVEADSFLIVGDKGSGTFRQTGGQVISGGGYNDLRPAGLFIGNEAGSNGVYDLVDGSVTQPSAKINAIIGNAGRGVFNQSGGTFDITACDNPYGCSLPAGVLSIANQTGSSGAYNLSGGSSTSDSVNVGIEGDGEFNQSGGRHVVNETLTVGRGGASGRGVYNMSGGVLVASDIVVNSNGAFNTSASSIDAGQFTNGGQLALVDPSVDTKIVGNYLQLSDGVLALGARFSWRKGLENSRMDVGGTATLGGILDFTLDFDLGPFAASSGRMRGFMSLFEVDLLSAETILGEFDVVNLPDLGALDPFFDWNISYILNDSGMDYVRLSMVRVPMGGRPHGGPSIAHTPEPATLLLMLPALAGVGFARRKKRCV